MNESETASNMDLIEEFERTIAGMEWEEVVSILEEMIVDLMGDASTPPNPSSSPPPPHLHSAEPDLSPLPQTEGIHIGAYSGCTPMGAALDFPSVDPSSLQQTHLNCTAGAHGQEQRHGQGQNELQSEDHHVFLTNEGKSMPVVLHPHNIPLYPVRLLNGAMLCQITCNPVNGEMLYGVLPVAAPCLGTGNGEMVYAVLPVIVPYLGTGYRKMLHQVRPAAALLNTSSSVEKERKGYYVKKPPNAFKLFSMEQRSKGMAELQNKSIKSVDNILRWKWKSMSAEDKAEYYQQAEREKHLHELRHPKRSTTSSCGKKRKGEAREEHLSDEKLGASM